jgi:hypothetical protein
MTITTTATATQTSAISPRHAQQYRAWLRAQAPHAETYAPIVVVDGTQAPQRRGTGYYFETPSGQICHHPNAYRRAFGRPIYCASTVRVEVGREWLAAKCIPVEAVTA